MKKSALLVLYLLFAHPALFMAQTVFVSSKGKKYHLENCHGLAPDKRAIMIEEAEKQGYKAHRGCKVKKLSKKPAAKRPKEA